VSTGALWPRVNRWLTWFHRWSGVVLCLLVIAWFVSGIVLLYVPFPALSEQERLAHSEPIDPLRITVEPAAALAQAPGADQLVLISVAGHPTYLASSPSGLLRTVGADDLPLTFPLSRATAQTVAERFAAVRGIRVDGPLRYDQWVVHQRFDPYRPFYRVRLADDDRTDLYVSASTGQVLQRTRGSERAWNWCGAVLHWIYFTPLRQSWTAWNQTVWWVSLVTLVASIAGTWLGIHRMLKSRQTGRRAWSPFRGWMRWHHIFGLFSSAIVLVWIFSGWLSMDHGRLFSRGEVPEDRARTFAGLSLDAAAASIPQGFLKQIDSASEVRVGSLAGAAFVAARGGPAAPSRLFWIEHPQSTPAIRIETSMLLSGLKAAWPSADIRPIHTQSDFYAVAESLGETAIPFSVGVEDPLRVYVDAVTGRLLVVMNGSRRAYAWVYYALHTFQFPGLLDYPTIRQTVVVVLMLVGLAFSGTGAVLGFQRLRRSVAR
jgi:uncharacterized iron-regulated membrane protein